MNKIYKIFACMILPAVVSCSYDPYKHDVPAVEEKLVLTSSVGHIVLNEETLDDVIVTFDWEPARQMPDEYVITYTTELDVVGNNFGSTTVIMNTEDDGVFSRSFTGAQIDNWGKERWNLPVNKDFALEFRVIASWTGGPTYEMPEVRVTRVEATPIKVIIFDADKMTVAGTSLNAPEELNKTLENTNLYAWVGDLTAGELQIPVELDGLTYYICPQGDGTLKDGQPEAVTMEETPKSWNISEAGRYRVVINMQSKEVTIYSPETDLQPLKVTFRPNGVETNPETTLEVSDLYAYGGGTGWGAKKLNLVQSLADPQVFVYSGAVLAGDMKFCISNSFTVEGTSYNQNNAYCFTAPLKEDGSQQNVSVETNKLFQLNGGADRNTRNSYLKIPSKTNFIIFDLRNRTLFATVK